MNFDNDTMDCIIQLVRKIVQEELNKQQKTNNEHLETYRHVKVIDTKNETNSSGEIISTISVAVQDMATKETLYKVPNESGKILEKGDIVRLYETNGSFCNQYIGLKCEEKRKEND